MKKIVSGIALVLITACGPDPSQDDGALHSSASEALTAENECIDGDPACAPSGAHESHGAFACTVCHKVAGRLSFDSQGPAYAAGRPIPRFDAVSKTCTNIACHGTVTGSYTYTAYDGDETVWDVTVPHSSDGSSATPSWYATGSGGCGGCHNYPPTAGGLRYAWHSGSHAQPTHANTNTCQFCHPDATGAFAYGTYKSTTGGQIPTCATGTFCSAPGSITNDSLHGNGVVDVQVNWSLVRSSCYPCH